MNLKEFKKEHTSAFSDEIPEYETLINLCVIAPVSVFEIENLDT